MQFVSNQILDRMCKVLGREVRYEKPEKTIDDLLNLLDRQQEEIVQYKLQEKLLLERLKRAESKLPVMDRALAKVRYSDTDDQY